MVLVSCLVLFVLFGSSVVVAAEGSVPGDVLYPVKIHVSEPIVGALKVSSLSKADWESEKTGRRLGEAEQLASDGKLDEQKKKDIQKNIEDNVNNLTEINQKIEESGNADESAKINKKFEDQADTHAQILEQVKARVSEDHKSAVSDIEETLKTSVERVRSKNKDRGEEIRNSDQPASVIDSQNNRRNGRNKGRKDN